MRHRKFCIPFHPLFSTCCWEKLNIVTSISICQPAFPLPRLIQFSSEKKKKEKIFLFMKFFRNRSRGTSAIRAARHWPSFRGWFARDAEKRLLPRCFPFAVSAVSFALCEKYKFRGKKPGVIVAGAMPPTISTPWLSFRAIDASFVEIPSARIRREGGESGCRKMERLPEISISAVCQNAGNMCEAKRGFAKYLTGWKARSLVWTLFRRRYAKV